MSPENWRRVDKLYNEVLEKPRREIDKFLSGASADFPPEVIARVEKLLRSPEEDDEGLVNALDAWVTTPLDGHRPSGIARPDRSIPRWLWELADRHGYEIREPLGVGGQGWVDLAYDRRHDEKVALKTMRYIDGACLMRFRQEFQLAAALDHSNLVRLHELISNGDDWFLTMELVEGDSFLHYVRPGSDERSGSEAAPRPTPHPAEEEAGHVITLASAMSANEESRLRHALLQLAEGLHYLHQNGMIHCDIKDNNVLVTARGVVKILDYGLIRGLNDQGITKHIQGTFEYMAPEQAEPGFASPASDWYSVGVMLYEALTGRLPFQGHAQRVLFQDKQNREPVSPRELVPTIPDDLNALCMDLLRRAPEARPSGEEILHRLRRVAPGDVVEPQARPKAIFIGRKAPLDELREAYAAVRDGHTVQVLVRGDSGIGKSTLLHHFLNDIGEDEEAVVLAGRCNERIVAPYEALRSIVDALTHYLRKPAPGLRVEALLPRDLRPLLRVFPVLAAVPALASAPRRPDEVTDDQESRRRAFAAFRELLQRLGDRRTVVLALDDLQWADLDSAPLLKAILRPPDSPRLLLLGCYRTQDEARSPFLRLFLNPSEQRMVHLEALAPLEAEHLVSQRLWVRDAALSAAIAKESRGNPFILGQLVDDARSGGTAPYERVVAARVARLPEAGRRLLKTLAVAARSLPIEEWFDAAGSDGPDSRFLEHSLRAGQFIRSAAPPARASEVEIYHDRIRESVLAALDSSELRLYHERLVGAFRRARPNGIPEADSEVLAFHLEGAEENAEASRYYGMAAANAARDLAFDRAAELCRRALRLSRDGAAGQRPLHEQLGAALANAGRGGEAAEAYLKAAQGADPAKNRDLRRRAAEQFLRSGHVKEGLRVLDGVLREVGLRVALTPSAARWSWRLRCAWVRLRGLRFRLRQEQEIPPDQLQLVDLCRSAAVGLTMVDPIRGADFQARNVLLALRAGEPGRIALALAHQAMLCAFFGGARRRYIGQLLRRARALSRRNQYPLGQATVVLSRGGIALAEGRARTAIRVCEQAEKLLRTRCTGIAWELGTAQTFCLSERLSVGQYQEYGARLPALLEDAEARGDLYTATHVRCRSAEGWLIHGQPDRAMQELLKAMEKWPRMEDWEQHGFHLQHYWFLAGQIEIALYRGDGARARKLATDHAPGLERSLLLQIDGLLTDWLFVRARSAIAAAVGSDPGSPQDARTFLRQADRDGRRLERINRRPATGMGKLVRAGVAAAEGRTEIALELLTEAERDFDVAGMKTLLAVARCRRAELCGSKTLYDETIASMSELKIQNPFAMLTMFAPGFERSSSVGGE
jgi:serine/threonine protein kinase